MHAENLFFSAVARHSGMAQPAARASDFDAPLRIHCRRRLFFECFLVLVWGDCWVRVSVGFFGCFLGVQTAHPKSVIFAWNRGRSA